MTTNKEIITALTLEKMFANECRIINLRYEYPGYTGDELFGIATSLSEDELICKYNKLLSSYIPYVLLPTSYGEVRNRFNGWKYEQEQRRSWMFESKIREVNRKTVYSTRAGKYTIEDIQQILSISRPTVYKMIDQGCFQTVRVGNRTMITKASFDIWLNDKED